MAIKFCPNDGAELSLRKIPNSDETEKYCSKCGFSTYRNREKLSKIYCILSVDDNGNEGILTIRNPISGYPVPLVTGDKEIITAYIEHTENLVRSGQKTAMVTYERVSSKDIILPGRQKLPVF